MAELEEAKNKEHANLQSALKEMEVQLADTEEAKNKEIATLQSALKEMEVQLADMEEAKNKESAKLQAALKELEDQLADMEEAKNKEASDLQSALKEMEVQLADMGEAKNKETSSLQSALKEMEVQLADMEEAKKKETSDLQSALKEMEARMADMEEAKEKEISDLQSALKEMETRMADMEEAKDKENAKLQSALKEMEVQLADMEDTKNKEITQLQSSLKEMEGQFQETKELLEAAQKEMEQLRATDNEKIENLTTDNEKLKEKVNLLEQELDETQKKYEETSKLSEDRLIQALDAESKIIDLKLDMQRLYNHTSTTISNSLLHENFIISLFEAEEVTCLVICFCDSPTLFFSLQEKISDMEAEDQILRQKERQSGTPSKKFDSNLTQSTIGRERDLVEALRKVATEDVGFCQGKPVATYVIYKSLLHWKTFEADITTVFDRIIQMMGSAIERTLSPSPPKPQQPASLFGRMTQGFRSSSNAGIVKHIEAKYPALLFKKQLAAYVDKIYGFIRNNLKKDLSQLLSSCIQAPTISDGNPYPTFYWEHIIERLNELLDTLKEYHVPSVIIRKMFAQVYTYIDVQLFNSLLLHKECCSITYGEYVKAGLAKLEQWCSQVTAEVLINLDALTIFLEARVRRSNHSLNQYADSSSDELTHVRQAVEFLVIQQKSTISYDHLTTTLCPVLSVQQHYQICTLYSNGNDDTNGVPPEVISKLKVLMTEDSGNPDSDSYLLDDNSGSGIQLEFHKDWKTFSGGDSDSESSSRTGMEWQISDESCNQQQLLESSSQALLCKTQISEDNSLMDAIAVVYLLIYVNLCLGYVVLWALRVVSS
ncbi:Dil domain-containing protein [Cynara cardunculus var. scolymus]|uniref:Dil domain-containing protein n=1 Tax=Cynara cardunculus var. scolymus TaxID=59895 RepID=A0A103Y0V3_CYNCS|nr:Dil domain-containing protein [Cynara cardunculus var. scolymus]